VLYVSPLKALSNDIRRNLQEPLAGIRERLVAMGLPDPGIRDAVRTGDTPAAERERMRRMPPHILVTTPESLYILLTSASGRAMLASVKSVIVDELHAVAGVKRGAHLALTLERLEALCERPPVRIGLSATVKPLDAMARFLLGARADDVAVIDAGHVRERDLAIEVPRSPAHRGDGHRGLGRDVRPPRRARPPAPHDARSSSTSAASPSASRATWPSASARSTSPRTTAAWRASTGSKPSSGSSRRAEGAGRPRARWSWASTSATSTWCASSDRRAR
jgi:Lhr-like helicase